MGLFSKENCCLCGGKTGLLDKKTAGGKVCKECRGKLSVWFDDYRESTADDLRAQLKQKEADLERIKTLSFAKAFGEFGVISSTTNLHRIWFGPVISHTSRLGKHIIMSV